MNALGIYLFVSLTFTLGSILELSVILALQRWYETRGRKKAARIYSYKRRGSLHVTSLIATIDGMAMIISFSAYTFFNAVYWAIV